jgi:chemotaxis-related protein WspB
MLVLTFQIGPERLALDVRQIVEVVPRVSLLRPAGGPPWLAGLFVYRGQVLPVIDLHRLTGAGDCPPLLSSRIIIVPHSWDGEQRHLGLLAANVADVNEVECPENPLALPVLEGVEEPDLGPVAVDGAGLVRLLDLDRLLPGKAQHQLAGVVRELPS